ncbi:hypothetical protein FB45DRAFT_513389 [Roridomyces roridus]|uniref:F-box domain-containing protein n=1 Tax=Roridomyces roridus TaxID=1738132 RepID=A0AAD7BWP5_9AGAR|nr:hypothetical protein FB45DRAFT_513389 [Roridomyces roridus]
MEHRTDIASLPSEILAQIFESATITGTGCLKTYSAVSSRWRASCLDYPHLWTNIRPFEMRDAVAWTAVSLERSQSCLFDVTLHLPRVNPREQPELMSVVGSVMLLVVQHVHRLHRLTIKGTAVANPEEIVAPLQNAQRAPNLRVLDLDFGDRSNRASMTTHQTPLLLEAPLSSLRLHGVLSPVAFIGLSRLEVNGLGTPYSAFRDVVVASPLLEELILPKLRLMTDLQSTSLPPIEIPSLKRLALSFHKPHPSTSLVPYHNLISLLYVPNLEYLELVGGNIPDLSKCFQDPGVFTKLRTLRLANASIFHPVTRAEPEIDNSEYLRALSTVEELQFIHSHTNYLLPTEHDAGQQLRSRLPRTRSISNLGFLRPEPEPHTHPHKYSPESPEQQPQLLSIFPDLRSISLDALPASQVLWLYRLVLERPEIKEVRLSPVTERHLTSSLVMVDGVLQTKPHLHVKRLSTPEYQVVDVGELLREKVAVRKIEADGYIQ